LNVIGMVDANLLAWMETCYDWLSNSQCSNQQL